MSGGRNTSDPEGGPTPEEERARAAFVLAIDLANEQAKVGFSRIHDFSGKRGRGSPAEVTEPRRIALYLATTVGDVSIRPLGKAAGVHPSTVAHHVEQVSDRREESPAFDAMIERLERKLLWRAGSIVMARLKYGEGEG
ncbi:hypothetical protein [Phenylobacterium sp.]|uniref:hypothetical protein n=1 Tax=Phenylobacterium sp. TaxID=1871053 RepID=UPI002FC60471